LWKNYCEDEGVRAVCQFIEVAKSVIALEILDNKVTALGCEFISRIIHPKANTSITILKLDHNPIGSDGVRRLSEGMAINKTVQQLSLTYCDIDAEGARWLFEILIFTKSQLKELNLSGNLLRNDGVIGVLRGLSLAKEMVKIYLADNQFNDDIVVMNAFKMCMSKNKTLGRYDLKYNNISDSGISSLYNFNISI
jgi:Ran GTPase-activating protein (RanGAP) involved in mRNA processing and transport